MAFFENLGFKSHPFAHTNADEEPHLADYYIPPPFFDAVTGDSKNPNATVVLAPRGGGKTAQRRMVEAWALSNKVLAVTYDRFEFGVGQNLKDIGLPYHLRNIIVRILITYLASLADSPDLIRQLDKSKKLTLSFFIHSYLGDMNGEKFQEVMRSIKSIPQRVRDYWSKNIGLLEPLINILLKSYGLDQIDLPDLKQEEKKLSSSYKHQLEIILEIIKMHGLHSIYILIDKLDESEKTGTSPERTYLLIQPIVRDLELLGLNGYGFKIFIWDKILDYFRADARPDRISQHSISWSRENLQKVLSARLSTFSDGKIVKFAQLLEKKPSYDVDLAICLFANHSPRNVIRICEKIMAVQAEMNSSSKFITESGVDRGILLFCEEITNELYGEEVCRDLKRAGRELFTINYLASSIFKTSHENTSRNKVTNWQNCGLVSQLGTVSVAGVRRPLNFYYVSDPAMIRLIHEVVPLEEFFKDRWVECPHCYTDNLMDINLIPDGNEPKCFSCNRNLF
ncbi:MAG: hypothetical protein L6277_13305 [Desulfobacterales bacterium]|nr:hypothetical protein [Pseudomonadota bacterium]MBU4353986.1 hypothetical protein [Pseudomonadota bacterium]MCG2773049.1 hypothetical protein [Desulfobacterales bacterium]